MPGNGPSVTRLRMGRCRVRDWGIFWNIRFSHNASGQAVAFQSGLRPIGALEPNVPLVPGPKGGEEGVEALQQAQVPPISGLWVFGWLKGNSQRDFPA